MKPITIDVQYWPKYERRMERVTVADPEKFIEDLKALLYQAEVSGLQITISKNHPIERGY